MFPSILGASVNKLSDRLAKTKHRSGFTDERAKVRFPGHFRAR